MLKGRWNWVELLSRLSATAEIVSLFNKHDAKLISLWKLKLKDNLKCFSKTFAVISNEQKREKYCRFDLSRNFKQRGY